MRSKQRKELWTRVWVYIALFGTGYLAFCALLAVRYVFPGHSSPAPPEDFRVLVDTKARLAWTMPAAYAEGSLSGDLLVVFVHGYGGTPSDWLSHMAEFQAQGIPSASLHLRGHGNSPERRGTFGREESADLIALVKSLHGRFKGDAPPRTLVVGLSLGGAVAWHAAAKEPELFHAIATEGTYTRFKQASERWISQVIPGAAIGLRPVFWLAEWLSGTQPELLNPVEDAKRWRRGPALIIQAEFDSLVPEADAREMARASDGELWIVPGVDHAAGSLSPEYMPRLLKLARKISRPQTGTLGQ